MSNLSSSGVSSRDDRDSRYMDLRSAVMEQNVKRLEELLDRPGYDVNATDEVDGSSLLHIDARMRCNSVCSGGVGVARQQNEEQHQQEEEERRRVVNVLLDNSPSLSSATNKLGNTPLHEAAKCGEVHKCQVLVKKGKAKVNAKNHKFSTPLHYAAEGGHSEIVKFLIEKGANTNHRDKPSKLPLHYAALNGRSECCEILARYYVKTAEGNQDTPLILAARNGHHLSMDSLARTFVSVNHKTSKGNTALHEAARTGGDFKYTVSKLLNMGADPNIQNDVGNTPVMEAIYSYNVNCVDTLIKAQADLAFRNKHLQTVLHIAVSNNSVECLRSILENGISQEVKDAVDNKGMTALAIAVRKQRKRCTKLLLDNGASRTAGDHRKNLLLHKAIRTRRSSSDFRCSTGESLLHLVLHKDLDVNMTDSDHNTPLHVAAATGSYTDCKRLLLCLARVDVCNSKGRTALHMAAQHGDGTVVRLLVRYHAKLNSQDNDKNTALHIAAVEGNLECCQELIRAGKYLGKIKNAEDRYPLAVAFHSQHPEVFKYLLETFPCNNVMGTPELRTFLHLTTHGLLNEADDRMTKLLEVIIESKWWRLALGILRMRKEETPCSNFKALIKCHPHLAKRVMDHCVSNEEEGGDHCVSSEEKGGDQFNYHVLEDKFSVMKASGDNKANMQRNAHKKKKEKEKEEDDPEKNFEDKDGQDYRGRPWKREHPVRLMIDHQQTALLQHPLTTRWLRLKWKYSTRFLFIPLLLQRSLSIAFLIFTVMSVRNWNHVKDDYGLTREEVCDDEGLMSQRSYYYLTSVVVHIGLLFMLAVHLAFEINGFDKMRRAYLSTNFLLVQLPFLMLTTFLFLPTSICEIYTGVKEVLLWQCGLVALILRWFDLLYDFSKLLRYNIFYMINPYFLKSYVKGTLYVVVVITVFALAFHVLLPRQEAFATFPRAMMKMVVWLRGDLAYDSTFLEPSLDYPIMANILFLIFSCVLGAFVLTLLKAPSTKKRTLRLYQKASLSEMILKFDMCFPCCKINICDLNNNTNTTCWYLNCMYRITNATTPFLDKLPSIDGKYKMLKSSQHDSDDESSYEEHEESDQIADLKSCLDEQRQKLDKLLEICNKTHCQNFSSSDSLFEEH